MPRTNRRPPRARTSLFSQRSVGQPLAPDECQQRVPEHVRVLPVVEPATRTRSGRPACASWRACGSSRSRPGRTDSTRSQCCWCERPHAPIPRHHGSRTHAGCRRPRSRYSSCECRCRSRRCRRRLRSGGSRGCVSCFASGATRTRSFPPRSMAPRTVVLLSSARRRPSEGVRPDPYGLSRRRRSRRPPRCPPPAPSALGLVKAHRPPNAVAEVPRGLVGHPERPLQLVRGDSLAGLAHHVDREEPLPQGKVRVVEHRPRSHREPSPALVAVELVPRGDPADGVGPAVDAPNALGPAERFEVGAAAFLGVESLDQLDEVHVLPRLVDRGVVRLAGVHR